MPEIVELVARFLMVGAVAFGGGGAALPLVERFTVAETGWLTPRQFSIGVGFAYATPGPILILAAFVGYYVAGVPGALAGTLAVFAIPVMLAAGSAGIVQRLNRYARFRAFSRFAGAGAGGLLAVTLSALAAPVLETHPACSSLRCSSSPASVPGYLRCSCWCSLSHSVPDRFGCSSFEPGAMLLA